MKKEIIAKMLDDTIFCNKELCKYNLQLEQENKIFKEALELACSEFQKQMNLNCINYFIRIVPDYFIEQAKENIK